MYRLTKIPIVTDYATETIESTAEDMSSEVDFRNCQFEKVRSSLRLLLLVRQEVSTSMRS